MEVRNLWRGWTGCALAALILVGACGPQQEPVVDAFDQTRASMAVAFGTVCEEAALVSHRSTQEALFSARRSAADLQGQFAEVPQASELDRLRRQVVRGQLERLDAAILVRTLRTECEVALSQMSPKSADASSARTLHRERDVAFRALDDRLLGAERAYHDACNRLALVLKDESLQASIPVQRG